MAATQAKADIESVGKTAEERQAARDEALVKAMNGLNLDKILEMTPNSLEAILKNEDAKRSIESKLTPETIKMVTSKASASQLSVLENVINTKKETLEKDEEKKLQKQADAQAKGMQPFVDAIQALANKKEPPPSDTPPANNPPPPPRPWESGV